MCGRRGENHYVAVLNVVPIVSTPQAVLAAITGMNQKQNKDMKTQLSSNAQAALKEFQKLDRLFTVFQADEIVSSSLQHLKSPLNLFPVVWEELKMSGAVSWVPTTIGDGPTLPKLYEIGISN